MILPTTVSEFSLLKCTYLLMPSMLSSKINFLAKTKKYFGGGHALLDFCLSDQNVFHGKNYLKNAPNFFDFIGRTIWEKCKVISFCVIFFSINFTQETVLIKLYAFEKKKLCRLVFCKPMSVLKGYTREY